MDEESQPVSRFRGLKRMFGRGESNRSPLEEEIQSPGSSPDKLSRPDVVEKGPKIEGVVTDQKLLQFFYGLKGIDAHPIATDRFLDKSRDEYNAAWLTRELVQNFVDHNPQHPGTLDGVRITSDQLENGVRRFRIEGDWQFEDPTGVLSPHSDKPEEMNTAGGNGIGLKQTAIRLMRDYGVQRFEIQGEGWSINYRLAKAKDVNREWESIPGQVPLHKVKHDWLLADVREAQRTGKNTYVIETSNPEVIRALEQLPTLGVSSENPYLQDMDYQNEFGGIKWLPKSEGVEPARGRLFINGQVMNYKDKGTTTDDYWVGPELVTIQLNNVRYRMSVDRPPVTPYELAGYLDDMVQAMTKEEMIEQLKRSEHLWAGHVDSNYRNDRQGAFVVIEKLTRTLPWKGYNRREWQQHFSGKNYIAWDRGVSESQIKELEKQGYIICPEYFGQVGMVSASSKLSTVEAASNEIPSVPQYKKEQFAQEYGMEVAYEEFPDVKELTQFIKVIGERLGKQVIAVEEGSSNPNIVRLKLKGEISKELLFHSLSKPKGDDQRLVYFLRGMAAYGLGKGLFRKIFTSNSDFITTFGLGYDILTKENTLLARNISNKSDEGTFVDIELDDRFLSEFKDGLKKAIEAGRGLDYPIQGGVGERISPTGDKKTGISQAIEVNAWTFEQEQLYQAAIKKNPLELTDEDRFVIEQRKQLEEQFNQIPVGQTGSAEMGRKENIVQKEASMSEAEKARVTQMEAQLPGIVEAVNNLETLVPEPKPAALTGNTPIEKYLQWRESGQFHGLLGENSGYLTGRHLVELINEQNRAEITRAGVLRGQSPENQILSALQMKLKSIVSRMNPAEDEVNDFDIVLEPQERQLAQLGLLRLYTHLTTGVVLPNDLFIYKGTGSKGINLGQKAIGLHESLFDTQFTEAMRTFVHEVAHNYPEANDHGNMFRHAMESLFVTIIDKVSQIANKLETAGSLTQEERVILDMQREWEKMRSS